MSLFPRRRSTGGLAAVGLYPDGVCVARVRREGVRRPAVEAYEFHPWGDEERSKVLSRAAARHQLKRARCTTVLAPDEYKLIPTEAPDVRPDELRAALRWRLKDLIDFHVNDAAIDAFELPKDNRAGQPRSMFAVVAKNDVIQGRADELCGAGINLDVIDIPELAQRNLAALIPEDAAGVALLTLTAGGGLITVTRQTELYFSRTLDMGCDALVSGDAEAARDRLVLEIQRSLDYVDSHFRQAPVGHLVLDGHTAALPGMMERFTSSLNVKVTTLDIERLLEWSVEPPKQPHLPVLGAALRAETVVL
ncbi:MAG: agglutinin biogenesis protein MshI [Acidiferrobacteraceae bacterium]